MTTPIFHSCAPSQQATTPRWSDANPEDLPIASDGRWVEIEALAGRGIVAPPGVPHGAPSGTSAEGVVAFAVWLALELAPDEVRAADVRAIREAVDGSRNLRHRLLPPEIGRPETAALVLDLVAWAARVGAEAAVLRLREEVRALEIFDLRTLVDGIGAAGDVSHLPERSRRADNH